MEIQPTQILFQIVNFAIILWALKKFLYKPTLRILDERAEKIREGLEAAEKNVHLQQELEDEKNASTKKARQEATKIIAAAKKEADELIRQAQAQAKSEAKAAIAKERQAWDAQVAREKAKLNQHLSQAVVASTQSVLEGLLDTKNQQQLIEAQIKKIDAKLLA